MKKDKIEELINAIKAGEFINRKHVVEEPEKKKCPVVLMVLAIVGAVAAIAGIAYAVYRYLTPDYLEDFEDDFEGEFEEDGEDTQDEAEDEE